MNRGNWRQRGRSAAYGALYGASAGGFDPNLDDPLTSGIMGALRGATGALQYRDEKKAEAQEAERLKIEAARAEEDRQRRIAADERAATAQELELARAGVRRGDAPGDGSGRDMAVDVGAMLGNMGGSFAGMPAMNIEGRYQQLGEGRFVDRYETPEFRQRQDAARAGDMERVEEMRDRERMASDESQARATRRDLYSRVQGGDREAEAELYGIGEDPNDIRLTAGRPTPAQPRPPAPGPKPLNAMQAQKRGSEQVDFSLNLFTDDDIKNLTPEKLLQEVLNNPATLEGIDPASLPAYQNQLRQLTRAALARRKQQLAKPTGGGQGISNFKR